MQAPDNLRSPRLDTWTGALSRAERKAARRSERSSDPERFMAVYGRTLKALHHGADLLNQRRLDSDLDAAAETEALSAYRLLMSLTHDRTCVCIDCRQMAHDRTQRE